MFKKLLSVIITFLILLNNFVKAEEPILQDDDNSYAVMDSNTGQIIYSYKADISRFPASLTKLMTLYLLFDELSHNRISLNTQIKVSKEAASQPPSKIFLKAGSKITVKDAIKAMIVRSANDVAYAVAEHLGNGNINNFVLQMNKKAIELKMYNTNFINPTGLPDPNQKSTALDFARLSRNLMTEHRKYYSLFSTSNFSWKNKKYYNTNHLLDYEGVDGIKTGYTKASGYNLITSAQKNDIRIISVLMGYKNSQQRDSNMKEIINIGFNLASNTRKQLIVQNASKIETEDNEEIKKLIESSQNNNYNKSNLNQNIIIKDTKIPYIKISYVDSLNTSKLLPNKNIEKKQTTPVVLYTASNTNNNNSNIFIQVGAFSSEKLAIKAIKLASHIVPQIKNMSPTIVKVNTKNNQFFRARITGLSSNEAKEICNVLNKNGKNCFTNS